MALEPIAAPRKPANGPVVEYHERFAIDDSDKRCRYHTSGIRRLLLTLDRVSDEILGGCEFAMTYKQIVNKFLENGARVSDDDAGATAIEFALIAPMLLMALLGILTYGLYFGAANSVQQLAADAARASIAGLSDQERATIARAHVAKEASTYVLLDPTKATVTAAASAADPNLFQVAVSYDASRMAIWAFAKLIPLPSQTIIRTSVIQRGGY